MTEEDFHFNKLLKKGMSAVLVQGVSMALLFVLNWYLAFKLGAKDYGVFTYAMSWVFLFGILSMLGLNMVIQREVIKYAPSKIRRLISFSRRVNFVVSMSIVVLFTVVVYFLLPNLEDTMYTPLLLAILSLPVFGQLLINKSVCIGLKHVISSQLPEDILRPGLAILGCFIIWQWTEPTVVNTVIMVGIGIFIAFITSIFLAHKAVPSNNHDLDNSEHQEWLKFGITLFLLTATVTINSKADILMLGFFGQTEQVGIYNIAVKLSALLGVLLIILNKVLTPYIAKHVDTDKAKLSAVIQKFMRFVFLIGVILFVIYYLFGEDLLMVFGDEFVIGQHTLIILSIGQLTNIFVGPVGNVLVMGNLEKISVKIMIISTIANIILNLALIPFYGMEGAAISTSIGLIIWNVAHYYYVRKKLNINPSVI